VEADVHPLLFLLLFPLAKIRVPALKDPLPVDVGLLLGSSVLQELRLAKNVRDLPCKGLKVRERVVVR
jgi:hypothetical protein